jgi:hypothetical protein
LPRVSKAKNKEQNKRRVLYLQCKIRALHLHFLRSRNKRNVKAKHDIHQTASLPQVLSQVRCTVLLVYFPTKHKVV